MKFFFYSVIGIYLLLYFYAVWVYEGFTLVTAISVLITLGLLGWLLVRGWASKGPRELSEAGTVDTIGSSSMQWYQSPLPYLLVIAGIVLIGFLVV